MNFNNHEKRYKKFTLNYLLKIVLIRYKKMNLLYSNIIKLINHEYSKNF
jgi:hypothetical protein